MKVTHVIYSLDYHRAINKRLKNKALRIIFTPKSKSQNWQSVKYTLKDYAAENCKYNLLDLMIENSPGCLRFKTNRF